MRLSSNRGLQILSSFAVVIIIASIFFIVDYFRVDNNYAPIFCVRKENTYYGLGYKINYYEEADAKYEVGTYFLEYDDTKVVSKENIEYKSESVLSVEKYENFGMDNTFVIGSHLTAKHIGYDTIEKYVTKLSTDFFDDNIILGIVNKTNDCYIFEADSVEKQIDTDDLKILLRKTECFDLEKNTCFTFITIARDELGNLGNIEVVLQ